MTVQLGKVIYFHFNTTIPTHDYTYSICASICIDDISLVFIIHRGLVQKLKNFLNLGLVFKTEKSHPSATYKHFDMSRNVRGLSTSLTIITRLQGLLSAYEICLVE